MPLGGLRIRGNKIDCECSSVVDLVEFLDYDQTNLGEFVVKNEFYSSLFCKEATNLDKTLMEFSRESIEHTERGEKKSIIQSIDNVPMQFRSSL